MKSNLLLGETEWAVGLQSISSSLFRYLSNPSKAIMTTVTLSSVFLRREFLRTYSTPSAHWLWTWFLPKESSTLFQAHFIVSWLFSLSNIPSHPKIMKSWSGVISKVLISGVAIITFGFPPYWGNLASGSPNVLQTESLPGSTLRGPTTTSGLEPLFVGVIAVLWYICPPEVIIRFFSASSEGLWSLLRL